MSFDHPAQYLFSWSAALCRRRRRCVTASQRRQNVPPGCRKDGPTRRKPGSLIKIEPADHRANIGLLTSIPDQ